MLINDASAQLTKAHLSSSGCVGDQQEVEVPISKVLRPRECLTGQTMEPTASVSLGTWEGFPVSLGWLPLGTVWERLPDLVQVS